MANFELTLDNRFTRDLPADADTSTRMRQVTNACFSWVAPTPVQAPKLVAHAQEVADLLDLSETTCLTQEFADVFAGNTLLEGMQPYAACYGGHQFGHWAGQLGDGRAMSLGEVKNKKGEHWEIQLKGSGPTPYSRNADGRAVIRSSVREFVCSEAMHHLGVPTTRALSLVSTGDSIGRDMFYDGRPAMEPGAVVCRVAPSFLRLGNYQMLAAREEVDNLRTLTDFTIKHFFPHLGTPCKETYIAFLQEVCNLTAELMVHWMRVGFVHGVMNTDNLSVLGLTIDYGPYGWLENYDPTWTPNTTDAQHRRYRFGAQPQVAVWNLSRFAEALHPLIGDVKPLETCLQNYIKRYEKEQHLMMLSKLGLQDDKGDADTELFNSLDEQLQVTETDMTIFYRALATLDVDAALMDVTKIKDAFYNLDDFQSNHQESWCAWLEKYQTRLKLEGRSLEERKAQMNAVNPKYVMRNYLAQVAIDDAEKGSFNKVKELLDVMRRPYDEQPQFEQYAKKRPEWARHRPGCSMLSCSS